MLKICLNLFVCSSHMHAMDLFAFFHRPSLKQWFDLLRDELMQVGRYLLDLLCTFTDILLCFVEVLIV